VLTSHGVPVAIVTCSSSSTNRVNALAQLLLAIALVKAVLVASIDQNEPQIDPIVTIKRLPVAGNDIFIADRAMPLQI